MGNIQHNLRDNGPKVKAEGFFLTYVFFELNSLVCKPNKRLQFLVS